MKRFLSAVIFIGALGINGTSSAAIITYNFTGTVFYSDGIFSTDAPVGATISGTYTVNTSIPDSNPGDLNVGEYQDVTTSLSFTVGGATGFTPGVNIIVPNPNHSTTIGNNLTSLSLPGPFDGYASTGFAQVNHTGGIAGTGFRLAMFLVGRTEYLPTTPVQEI